MPRSQQKKKKKGHSYTNQYLVSNATAIMLIYRLEQM